MKLFGGRGKSGIMTPGEAAILVPELVMRKNARFPKVSPGVQGAEAITLLTPQQRYMLEQCLDDAAKHYECGRKDLEWALEPGGRAFHVRRRPGPVVV